MTALRFRDHEAILCEGQSGRLSVQVLQMLSTRGQMDCQRWLTNYEIARGKAIEAWLDISTPRPVEDHADVVAEVNRRRQAEQERRPAEVRQTFAGPLEVFKEPSTQSHYQMLLTLCVKQARETVWRRHCRGRVGLFPTTENLEAIMALVMADLTERQRDRTPL